MAFFKIGVLLAATCLTAVDAYAATKVKELPGYSQMTVSSQFEEHLAKDSTLVKRLADDADLSRLVMSRAVLQQQLIDKKISIDEIAKQYFPHRYSKDEKEDARNADDNGFFSQARNITSRTIAALSGTTARRSAQQDIDKALDDLADADSKIAIDEIVASLTSVEAVMAYLQKHPEHSADILSHQAIVDMMVAAGMKPEDANKPAVDDGGGGGKPADPTKPAVDDGGGHGVQAPAVADVNLNARPTDVSLDANGWPKYLKVPADCPARPSDKVYTHAWTSLAATGTSLPSPVQLQGNGQALTNLIQAIHHAAGYAKFAVWPLTKLDAGHQHLFFQPDGKHEFSIPLHTPIATNAHPDDGQLGWMQSPILSYSISYCPGDYQGVTPAGKPQLGDSCKLHANGTRNQIYYRTVAPEQFKAMLASGYNQTENANCVLEENTQYFLNIQLNDYAKGWAVDNNATHMKHKFTPRTMRNATNMRPPYTGVCYQQEPYPINFSTYSCGGEVIPARINPATNRPFDYLDNERREVHTAHHCYDPYDGVAPWHTVSVGNNDTHTETITQGYGKAASSRYTCEMRTVSYMRDGSTKVSQDMTRANPVAVAASRLPGVCAAHREGQMREWLCGSVTTLSSTEHAQTADVYLSRIQAAPDRRRQALEQCQFNAETQRYDWMMIEQQQRVDANQMAEVRCVGHVRDIEPNEVEGKQCTYNGQSYAIGTRLEGSDGTAWECRRSGVKRHTEIEPLPVFYPVKLNLPHSALRSGLFARQSGQPEVTVTVVPPAE